MKRSIQPNCIYFGDDGVDYQRKDGAELLKREVEIDHTGKLWPCCVWIEGWENTLSRFPDERLAELLKDDPNFNDLTKYTMDEILQHPIYKSYLNAEGWESDNPSPLCLKECGVNGTAKVKSVAKIWKDKKEE